MQIYPLENSVRKGVLKHSSIKCLTKVSIMLQILYLTGILSLEFIVAKSIYNTEISKIYGFDWITLIFIVIHTVVIQSYLFQFRLIELLGFLFYSFSSTVILLELVNVPPTQIFLFGTITMINWIVTVLITAKYYKDKREMHNENNS